MLTLSSSHFDSKWDFTIDNLRRQLPNTCLIVQAIDMEPDITHFQIQYPCVTPRVMEVLYKFVELNQLPAQANAELKEAGRYLAIPMLEFYGDTNLYAKFKQRFSQVNLADLHDIRKEYYAMLLYWAIEEDTTTFVIDQLFLHNPQTRTDVYAEQPALFRAILEDNPAAVQRLLRRDFDPTCIDLTTAIQVKIRVALPDAQWVEHFRFSRGDQALILALILHRHQIIEIFRQDGRFNFQDNNVIFLTES
jgi:hypothetical protein